MALYGMVPSSLNSYMNDISEYDLLSPKEEQELGKKIKEEDDEDAKEEMMKSNLRLVINIANHYKGQGLDFLDLIQEGNLGLITAINKFDYSKGYRFSTYATWWIRQAITRALSEQSRTIRVPNYMVEKINRLIRVTCMLIQEFGREPTDEELSARMDISEEEVKKIKGNMKGPVSLDSKVGDESDSELGDFVENQQASSPDKELHKTQMRKDLEKMLSTLTDREGEVLKLRFGLKDGRDRTLEQISKEFGVTRERIRQIESKALRKMRHPSRCHEISDYIKR